MEAETKGMIEKVLHLVLPGNPLATINRLLANVLPKAASAKEATTICDI
jgi:hypothetical protein